MATIENDVWDSESSGDLPVDEDDMFNETLQCEGSSDNGEDPSGSEDASESARELDDNQSSDGGPSQNLDVPNGNVEHQIEGEFERLLGNIRNSDDVANDSMMNRIWDAPLHEDFDAEFQDDLRAASGIGRKGKGKGKGKRSRKQGPTLSHQVRALIGEGNHAYVDGNLPEAIRLMQEVIRIEPRATPAWSVLATCYRDMDEPLKALQLSVMRAHLLHDADEWDQLAIQSRQLGYNQQALYCYRKVVSLDPTNVNASWERATLAKDIGDLKTARHAYLGILKHYPHDTSVLNELRHILIELSDLALCATLFQRAFDHYTEVFPSGRALDAEGEEVTGGGFTLMELFMLTDLYNTLGDYEKAIKTVRSGCRWLQGRMEQKFWDTCPDDREYDYEGFVRDNSTVRLQPGFYPLDINARHRLAVARLKLGETSEGRMHADIILSQNVMDFSPLFGEIADAYFERGMFAEARPIYELLGADAGSSSMHILLQAAACRRNLGDLREAAEDTVITTDPGNNDAKMKLAEIYEITNEPRKALDLVYQVIDSRKKRAAGTQEESTPQRLDSTTTSLFEEKPRGKSKPIKAQNRLSKTELQDLEQQKEEEVQRGYQRVLQLWPVMLRCEEEAEREWLLEAEKLVESFRETRNLFVTSGSRPFLGVLRTTRDSSKDTELEEDHMASRLHLDLQRDTLARKAKADGNSAQATVLRGINFDDWLVLIMQYAFLLTRRDQFDMAEEILRHILISTVYQSRTMQDTIRLALITCAIRQRKHSVIMEHSRKLIFAHQFNNEPLRIMLAVLASGLPPTDCFILSSFQKHLFREIKLGDAVVKGKPVRWIPSTRRYAPIAAGEPAEDPDDDGEAEGGEIREDLQERFDIPEKPSKNNAVIVAIYGMSCTAVRSYQSALFYLLHAYDYCPNDPMVCLSLAVASIGRAMQRQADNRNYLITQAFGFLSQYRSLRRTGGDGPEADEIEFNFGRAFHQLGLLSHAVQHYERALQIVERRIATDEKDFGVARESAYNLSLIYITTGATGLAQGLYRRWLSL